MYSAVDKVLTALLTGVRAVPVAGREDGSVRGFGSMADTAHHLLHHHLRHRGHQQHRHRHHHDAHTGPASKFACLSSCLSDCVTGCVWMDHWLCVAGPLVVCNWFTVFDWLTGFV